MTAESMGLTLSCLVSVAPVLAGVEPVGDAHSRWRKLRKPYVLEMALETLPEPPPATTRAPCPGCLPRPPRGSSFTRDPGFDTIDTMDLVEGLVCETSKFAGGRFSRGSPSWSLCFD
jgi:hypothetical protein